MHIYAIKKFDGNSDDPVKTGRFSAFFYKFTKKLLIFDVRKIA